MLGSFRTVLPSLLQYPSLTILQKNRRFILGLAQLKTAVISSHKYKTIWSFFIKMTAHSPQPCVSTSPLLTSFGGVIAEQYKHSAYLRLWVASA